MASYNSAMIAGYIKQHYPGLPTDDQFVQNIMNNSQGGDPNHLDEAITSSPQYQQQQVQQATQQYQAGIGSATSTLTTQRSNLSDQYGSLLQTVTGQYQPLINQTTATTGAALSKRGLTPDSQLYQQEVQGALQPIYGAEAGNAQTIGQGSITDYNTLTQAIAGLTAGGAGTASQLPLQYGSLALSQQALPSQIAAAQAQANAYNTQAKYIPVSPGGLTFNTASNSYISPVQSILASLGYRIQ